MTAFLWSIWEWTVASWGEGNTHERLTSIAILGAVLIGCTRIVGALRGRWGKFELRFLDHHSDIDPEHERRSTALRLLPGESSVLISLRPRTHITNITRFTFTAFSNRNYPMRLKPGSVGKERVPTTAIVATHFRLLLDDGSWDSWRDISVHERRSDIDVSTVWVRGARRVLEVLYKVDQSKSGWDGILGCTLHYETGSGNEREHVDSKAFVGTSGHTPLTFKLRRVHSSKPI